jgi:hypothetical protein
MASQPTHHSGPSASPPPLAPPSFHQLLPPSSTWWCLQRIWGKKPQREGGSAQWSKMGIFIGRLLGFEGASERCRCGTGGDAAAIRRASATGGGAHGWRRHGVPPAPTTSSRGALSEEKRWEKERADRWAPHGSDQEERLVVDGPAGCVGPKGQATWLSSRAGVKEEGGLADLY